MTEIPLEATATQDRTSERAIVSSVNWLNWALVVVLWVLFALWAHNYQLATYEQARETLQRQRSVVSEEVDSVLRLSEAFLAGANVWISDHPGRDPSQDGGFAKYVQAFQRVTNQSMLVRLAGAKGGLTLVPAGDDSALANVADRDYFSAAMRNAPGVLFISTPFQGRVSGKWVVAVSTRLSRPSHGIAIVLVAIELSIFDKAFRNARIPEGGAISLIRGDGILLARSGATPVELGIDMSRAPTFTAGLIHQDSGVVFTQAILTDGIPKMVAYGRLADFPVVVAVSQSISAIERSFWRTFYAVAFALVLATLIALLARWRVLILLEKLSDNRRMLDAAEQELRGALREIEQKERSKSQFLAATSHDLRQPLYAAQLFADSLALTALDSSQMTSVEKIRHALGGMSKQLQLLLDVSRLEGTNVEVSKQDISSIDFLEDLAGTYSQIAMQANVRLLFHPGEFILHTDRNLLSHLIGNLIDNAIKFSLGGTVLVCVRRAAEQGQLIQVRDNGQGIAGIHHEAVFDDFYQVGNKERNAEAGYGLGLSIVSRIARLLGIEIHVSSAVGKGSVFSVVVPK